MSPVPKHFRLASIRRWIDVLSMGVLAATAYVVLLRPFLAPWVGLFLDAVRCSSGQIGLVICALASVLLLIPLHRLAGSRIRHFQHVHRYPPLGIAVLVGLVLLTVLPSELPAASAAALSSCFAFAAAVAYFATLTLSSIRIPSLGCHRPKHPNVSPEDALKRWIEREEPINDFTLDRFGHGEIAIRLVDRLTSGESTIALQGAYGSGKSGLCRLAELEATRRKSPLRFVFVSCWSFEKTENAQRHVLESILSSLGDEVDALAIRRLPADYLDTVSADISWLRTLFKLGIGELSPLEQLQRFSSILAAIDQRIVVVIEDVDRKGEDFDIGRIQSLLMQFREVPGLSFILAISPVQEVDFVKLCDYLEVIPPLEPIQVLHLLNEVRELALKEHRPAILLTRLDPLLISDRDFFGLQHSLHYYWPWQLALAEILNSPRVLKHALRRIFSAWGHLHGEVHFDHLISTAALRAGAPAAFSFLSSHFRYFEVVSNPNNNELRSEVRLPLKEHLSRDWRRLCATRQFHVMGAAGLLRDILPATGSITELVSTHTVIPQSAYSTKRGAVYARRLFTERTELNEVSDQKMLGLLKYCPTEPAALRELAEVITTSHFASNAFEHFISMGSFNQHLSLFSEICAFARRSLPSDTHGADLPGFIATWRNTGKPRPEGFDAWLQQEIKTAAEAGTHLRLLSDTYYFWLDTNRHSRSEREAVRSILIDSLKRAWTALAPEKLAAAFPSNYPYTLFHLIFTLDYERPTEVPLNNLSDWNWSATPLLRAAQVCPEVVLPQILWVLNMDSMRGGDQLRYQLDEARMQEWFGEHIPTLHKIAATFTVPAAINAEARYLTQLALEALAAHSAKKKG